jgi:hypothetical protein
MAAQTGAKHHRAMAYRTIVLVLAPIAQRMSSILRRGNTRAVTDEGDKLPAGTIATGLGAVAALAIVLAPAAQAGTYPMYQCRAANGAPGAGVAPVSVDWQLSGPAATGTFNECSAGGGFGFRVPGSITAGDGGSIGVDVPSSRPHITIVDVSSTVDSGGGPWTNGDKMIYRQFTGATNLTPDDHAPYTRTGTTTLPLGAREFDFGFFCTTGTPDPCSSGDSAHGQRIGWATLGLTESDPPSAATAGGSLLAAGAVGGVRQLDYVASDEDSGVRRVVFKLGSTAVASAAFDDECAYYDWNACPNGQSRVADVDTRAVPDGTWPLYFEVTDAAQNTATIDSGKQVTTANGNPGGGGGGGPAQSVFKSQGRTVRIRFGKPIIVTGQSATPDGKPMADVKVGVFSRVGSQDFVSVGETKSGADGSFAYIAPTGPNRTIEFRYAGKGPDGGDGEVQYDVPVEVRAGVRLAVDKEKVRPGQRIVLHGHLTGGPLPPRGVTVGFRAKVGRHTRKFGDVQTDAKGHFKLRYRFLRNGPNQTYPLWVRVAADGTSYPYLPGLSNRVRVKVRR